MRRLLRPTGPALIPVTPEDPIRLTVDEAAAQWLARMDRGLTPEEQDGYLQWLRERPEHGAAIARLQRVWTRLDALRDWRPEHSNKPNPDLLAPPRKRRRRWIGPTALAAAAALVMATGYWIRSAGTPATAGAIVHPGPRHLTLADGSLVELNADAQVDVHYTPAVRAVRLRRGEAHFVVAKNAARPFVVSADRYTVRAVGTAFDVKLGETAVAVLVTEGKVQFDENARSGPHELTKATAGQLVTAPGRPETGAYAMRELTPTEMETALAWRSIQLEFVDQPLRRVAAEFNRYNTRKLIVEDEATGAIRVGGNFRADNLDAFVRVLDLGCGVRAEPRGEDLVLRRR